MDSLKRLEWKEIRKHYEKRVEIHKELLRLFDNDRSKFVKLLLAVKNPAANYSANAHSLGARILSENIDSEKQVFNLANKLMQIKNCHDVPEIVLSATIKYLQISVGSEMACMLNPNVCWVTNMRTVTVHLYNKHGGNIKMVTNELNLYRNGKQGSEMSYDGWCSFHMELDTSMTRHAEMGSEACKEANAEPGEIKYIWADCIASALYEKFFP